VHEIITQPRWLRWLIARLVTTWATHVVANSGPAASHLLALGAAPGAQARLSVIPDAVDTTRFHPNNDSRPLRSTWGIAPDQVLIGVVGRIHTGKGHGVLVEAVSMLHDRCPQARFVVVGDVVPGQPQPKHDLEAAIARHGLVNRVTLAGFCADAPSVMAALDVLVLPSTSPEPFGLVLVEAMASAKPVVATAHGGPLDIILDGQTGLLVPPGDAQALAAALERLIADPGLRAAMGAAGRKRAEAQFAFEPHVAAFQSLYDRALHSDHRRQTQ
jgi:glycosyltransferase involved in cell wall biosynthesis